MYVPGRFKGQVFVYGVGSVVVVSFFVLIVFKAKYGIIVDLETTYPRLDRFKLHC